VNGIEASEEDAAGLIAEVRAFREEVVEWLTANHLSLLSSP
jgi:hypothetical protein